MISVFLCLTLSLLSTFIVPSQATLGVDISTSSTIDGFKCLQSQYGYDYAIIRAYRSLGEPDTNAPHSIYNAADAGIKQIDVYLFPCPGCASSKPASQQVQEMVAYLQKFDAQKYYRRVWLDIEAPSLWGSQSDNRAFFEGLVSELQALNQEIGVYTSASQWVPIMGSDYTAGSSFPLWYAHYDGEKSFSDFTPFGGWSQPTMKQYAGSSTTCGIGIDSDWMP